MSFVNDLVNFIVFILAREVKVYALFGTNQVGDIKIMFITLSVAAKTQFGG